MFLLIMPQLTIWLTIKSLYWSTEDGNLLVLVEPQDSELLFGLEFV